MKAVTLIFILIILCNCGSCNPKKDSEEEVIKDPINMENMKLKITINGTELMASLLNNSTAHDFINMLPMTITLDDYNSTEKINTLNRKLDTTDTPDGYTPFAGDIAYYIPWGNLCIFYRDFRYSSSLIKIGKIEGDISILKVADSIQNVKFELVENN